MLAAWTVCLAEGPNWAAAESPQPRDTQPTPSDEQRLQGLIEGLRRMDADKTGFIEPDEISNRARPYIERWARFAKLDAEKPLSVKALENSLRRYYQNRELPPTSPSKRPGRSPSEASPYVRDFSLDEDQPPVPGFGEILDPSIVILQSDLDTAASRLRSYDRNHDGYMDRHEATRGSWSGEELFAVDFNHDNRLSQRELAVRYARKRIYEAKKKARYTASRAAVERREKEERKEHAQRHAQQDEERRRRLDPRNREAYYLSGSVMYRYDVNRNGVLEPNEYQNLGEKAASADADGHGRVDRRELAQWLLQVADKSQQNLPPGLPEWFLRRDANADAQVTMAEFAEEWTEEKVAEFQKYDGNSDGVVTPDECLSSDSLPIGTFGNHQLQIISAGRTVYSEIVVPDGEPIVDLDVQISITHTYDAHLDAFLIGPYGERVELFTGVGRDDDHFQNTIFDDEARRPITEGKPPFIGAYRPEAAVKRQPSLSQFYGKPINGTWTLVIQAIRSDRPGALHGWALIAKTGRSADEPEGSQTDRDETERSQRDRSKRDRPAPERPSPRKLHR